MGSKRERMKTVTRKRPRLGDIIEIRTPRGLAYFQYTHQHLVFGGLIRVLPGIFDRKPENLEELVMQKELFIGFFPVRAACNCNITRVVAEAEIPERNKPFPLFKDGVANKDGVVECWWLWDGEKSWKVGKWKDEYRNLPDREIWSDTFLVERIVEKNVSNHQFKDDAQSFAI
jgi:hypothetical protein